MYVYIMQLCDFLGLYMLGGGDVREVGVGGDVDDVMGLRFVGGGLGLSIGSRDSTGTRGGRVGEGGRANIFEFLFAVAGLEEFSKDTKAKIACV